MEEASLKTRAIDLYESSGGEELTRLLESIESTEVLVELCSDLVLYFYWDRKDLASALKYGKYGIAHRDERRNPEPSPADGEALEVDCAVKRIHYNMACFTWPGWDEPGILIGNVELDAGLQSAHMNLKLAQDLRRGPLAEARALWLLACHLLARGDYSRAAARFESSTALFRAAEQAGEELMSVGFLQLTHVLSGDRRASDQLQTTLERLSDFEGGASFVSQIQTAHEYFKGAGKAAQTQPQSKPE